MIKRNFGRLKVKMWLYFFVFTVVVIGLVWIFQIIFTEGYYENEKTSSMKQLASTLSALAENEEGFSDAAKECAASGMSVYVVTLGAKEGDGVSLLFSTTKTDPDEIGGFFTEGIEKKLDYGGTEYVSTYKAAKKREDFLYLVRDVTYKGESAFMFLTSQYAELAEAASVLRLQYMTVAIIVVIIGFALSWYLSEKLSKPIDVMSETAKRWAEGDESVVFKADGYKEIHELADALNYAKEGVSRSGELQRDLLANVSHDLKTPLTMIKAYAEMINDISGDNKVKREKHTRVIIDEADRLTMLVNDILNLSKLQSSVEPPEMKEINLSLLTERVIGRFSDYVENKGYKIEDYIAPDLITVADEKKVEQVIYNLLGNSINYTGEDKTVKVYLTAENDKILLEIIDSGKGISKEKLDTIWERYYRFSETNTRPVKGTGLGLSIVKAILDSHKLRYGVRSKKDCGSNFFVEFNRVKNE